MFQPTVTFLIGDHVNVLNDYKKMGPSQILKLLTCLCHHLIDVLIEFNQSLIPPTFINAVNVYQFLHELLSTSAMWRNIAKNPSAN